MKVTELFELVFGDLVLALVIGGIYVFIGNRNQQQQERQLEKELKELKEVLLIYMQEKFERIHDEMDDLSYDIDMLKNGGSK